MRFAEAKLVKVDKHFPVTWEIKFEFWALEVRGRCFASEILDSWSKTQKSDFKKIAMAAKLVGQGRPVTNPNFVKPDEEDSGVYEMRAAGRSARLMFYYAAPYAGSSKEGVVILLDYYWKTKQSKKEQERCFAGARRLMELAEQYLDKLYDDTFCSAPVRKKGKLR